MDYKEAIKEAETQINMCESMILYNKDFEPKNDNSNYERKVDFLKTAISAMQDLEEYHKTGLSPEQVSDTICELSATKIILGHYKQLGTLEEVRDAVEKQKAKKTVIEDICRNGVDFYGIVYQEKASVYKCPACDSFVGFVGEDQCISCCACCGQKLDWTEVKK